MQEGSEYQLIIARKLDGKVTECDYNAKVVKIEVLDKDTGKPIEVVTADCERDNFMTAQEALAYGLIDQVIEKR